MSDRYNNKIYWVVFLVIGSLLQVIHLIGVEEDEINCFMLTKIVQFNDSDTGFYGISVMVCVTKLK